LNEDTRLRDAGHAELGLLQALFAGDRYRLAPELPVKLLRMPDPVPCRVLGAATIVQPEEHNDENVAIILDVEVSALGEYPSGEMKDCRCLSHVYGIAHYRDGTYSNLQYSGARVCKLLA
jgi:hypothetical protein